jgi:predicted N-formylglutamate amidohydrolase
MAVHPRSVLVSCATLLGADDPNVFGIQRATGRSAFLLTADHAGRAIPHKLAGLKLSEHQLSTHIAWDLGVAELGRRLSEYLDAFLITQSYSRLVIDANRPPGAPDSIPTFSARTRIAANERLSPGEVRQRVEEVFQPYHDRIRDELDARIASACPTVLVALHSFTPVYMDQARPWHVGVLYGRDARLGRLMLAALRADGALNVGNNQPYSVSDATDTHRRARRAAEHPACGDRDPPRPARQRLRDPGLGDAERSESGHRVCCLRNRQATSRGETE